MVENRKNTWMEFEIYLKAAKISFKISSIFSNPIERHPIFQIPVTRAKYYLKEANKCAKNLVNGNH